MEAFSRRWHADERNEDGAEAPEAVELARDARSHPRGEAPNATNACAAMAVLGRNPVPIVPAAPFFRIVIMEMAYLPMGPRSNALGPRKIAETRIRHLRRRASHRQNRSRRWGRSKMEAHLAATSPPAVDLQGKSAPGQALRTPRVAIAIGAGDDSQPFDIDDGESEIIPTRCA